MQDTMQILYQLAVIASPCFLIVLIVLTVTHLGGIANQLEELKRLTEKKNQ